MHPIQRMIETLHGEGRCPRLRVDVTQEQVVCPDFVVERHGESLIIDLDPEYPLDLAFTEVGVEADLSFGGFVTRCVFPFAAIYMIFDRETGRGMKFDAAMPESVRRQQAAPKPAPKPKPRLVAVGDEGEPEPSEQAERAEIDPDLAKVKADSGAKRSRRKRRKRRGEASEAAPPKAAPPKAAPVEAAPEAASEPEAAPTADVASEAESNGASEERAQTRRAAFRVIDGSD